MGVFGELNGSGKAFWDRGLSGFNGTGEIVDAGQLVIERMRRTTGVGEPENGDRFGQGWSRFNGASEMLMSAFPNDSWEGGAADAYVDQNRAQTGRTSAVALIDKDVHAIIARQARQVRYHRDRLDGQAKFLTDLHYMATALAFVPGVGKATKTSVEAAAVNAALGPCTAEVQELSREAAQNAAELQQAVSRYADVAE
jgi:EspA/EspE family